MCLDVADKVKREEEGEMQEGKGTRCRVSTGRLDRSSCTNTDGIQSPFLLCTVYARRGRVKLDKLSVKFKLCGWPIRRRSRLRNFVDTKLKGLYLVSVLTGRWSAGGRKDISQPALGNFRH